LPLTEEIRPKIFESPDSVGFLPLFSVTGTPVYFAEKMLEFFGTPVKTYLKVGESRENLLKFWQS